MAGEMDPKKLASLVGKSVGEELIRKGKREVTAHSMGFIKFLFTAILKVSVTTLICLAIVISRGTHSFPLSLQFLMKLFQFMPQQHVTEVLPVNPKIQDIAHAIIGQESGHNCGAVNPDSGALGYGQVMPENLGTNYNWGVQTVGYNVSPDEFMADCELQVRIIHGKLKQYYEEGLAQGEGEAEAIRWVAAKWYSGQGSLKDSRRPEIWAETGVEYPSIGDYADQVLARVQGGEGNETNEVQTSQHRGNGSVTFTIQWPSVLVQGTSAP